MKPTLKQKKQHDTIQQLRRGNFGGLQIHWPGSR